MTKIFRDSGTGRFTDAEDAAERPAETVSEARHDPVNLEAGAEAFYCAWVMDGPDWTDLGQEYRDRLRHALRNALEAL